jgi:hypothetical protein
VNTRLVLNYLLFFDLRILFRIYFTQFQPSKLRGDFQYRVFARKGVQNS